MPDSCKIYLPQALTKLAVGQTAVNAKAAAALQASLPALQIFGVHV
jgi:hypothetical protein